MNLPVLDVNLMLAPTVSGGVDPSRLEGDLAERFRAAHADVEARRRAGEIGFFDLPWASETSGLVKEVADSFGQWFENVVVLGIGGSGLGAVTVRDALLGPYWNERDQESREYFPRLYVLDNPDPATVGPLLDRLDLRRTLFNVVSKSGSTAETMALYLVIRDRLETLVGADKLRGHFIFTTDPAKGVLRQIAAAEGMPTLPVPPNVGGRFSVLSAVGLWPAAVTGVDIDGVLAGAGAMVERCATDELGRNPAGLLATLLHQATVEGGKPIHVLMPYSDRLRSFALWFQQLWAESLGKAVDRSGKTVHTGATPLPAVGAVDQHSQVQLFMEGPLDKVVVFIAVNDPGDPVAIPALHGEMAELGYLGGHTLGELLDAERRATAEALRQAGRPSMTIEIERVDAAAVGALFMLFQIATVYAGALFGVDPLDQPGVELGKRLTYGLLGREGFPAPSFGNADPRWLV
ncbi:MAG: glucose-6-phosphate isomerase [Gemmatimonadetes bacterium]|nr:glucose-6-phosphate isomerase [Gemmatimonadota bacterium]